MLSSTSSSKQRLPQLAWQRLLSGGLLIAAAFIGVVELRLAARGYKPSVLDSAATWIEQRQRADALGSGAIVLVGGSRILLDTDAASLRRETGLEPVQLAVDGSSFVPVLADLAADPGIRGTVLVDFEVSELMGPARYDTAYAYEEAYAHRPRSSLPNFKSSEAFLTDALHAHLRSYSDGARPLTQIRTRILEPRPTAQYLRMLPDREVLADYRQVEMPAFYYFRVMRNLGEPMPEAQGMNYTQLEADIQGRIAALSAIDNSYFLSSMVEIEGMANAIEARGGRVLFMVFPKSGDVEELDDRRFPRTMFWDRFAALTRSKTLYFSDIPALRTLVCPDGSHLDYHDRGRFTRAMVAALHLEQPGSGPH